MNEKIIQTIFPFYKKSFRISEEKRRLRYDMRFLKDELSDTDKEFAAEKVFNRIEKLPQFISAQKVLIYWSTPDELPTHEFIKKWHSEKFIVLPSIKGKKLVLKHYSPTGKMVQHSLGIWEPDLIETYPGKVDLIIVPGVGFDWKKNRLGRGKGYYDRFFKRNSKALKIGVGFDFQLLKSIPVSRWDYKLDKIITPTEIVE